MNGPSTAREALIAEAIGDLARLLDQAQALLPAIGESSGALVNAHKRLAEQLTAFEGQVTATTDKLKLHAVKYIVARADAEARRMVEAHTRAMSEVVRPLFKAEIDSALARLAVPLQRLEQREGRLQHWLIYTTMAVVASSIIGALAAWLLTR